MKMIRPLEVHGDHREVGVALGRAAGDAFREVVPRIERYRALERQWLGSDRLRALEQAGRARHPTYMRELEGIAEGAGAPFERVLLWNCRGDLPGGGDQTRAGSLGCTTFLFADGIVAHNEDDQLELDGHCWFVDVRLTDGTGFRSFYSPGLLPGHTFAVTHRGLVQTINHLRTLDQRIGVPRHLSTRAVLDCTSLDAAVELLQGTGRAGGFHHNLAMAGDSRLVSVEAPASGFTLREVSGASAHANHLVYQELADVEQTIAPSSGARQTRAAALVAAGESDPRSLLSDTDGDPYPIYRKASGTEDPGHTLASAVFTVRADAVEYAVYASLDREPEHAGRVAVAAPPAAAERS